MPWFPGAIRKEIRRHRTAIVGPRRLVLHTAVSSGSSLFTYFNVSGRPTSHFYVRADGTVEQYVDTRYRAPAQLNGNHDSISVETQDMGGPFPKWSGSNVPAWTPQQVESLAQIGAWLHKTHGIKLQACPNSRPGSLGFAYHRQGIDPWRVSGGEVWSNARGKVCPGDRRVAQIPSIIARAKQIAAGTKPRPAEEDDMPSPKELRQALFGQDKYLGHVVNKHSGRSLDNQLHTMQLEQRKIAETLSALTALHSGADTASVLATIKLNHQAEMARYDELAGKLDAAAEERAELLQCVQDALSGERDATDALRAMVSILQGAVGDSDESA